MASGSSTPVAPSGLPALKRLWFRFTTALPLALILSAPLSGQALIAKPTGAVAAWVTAVGAANHQTLEITVSNDTTVAIDVTSVLLSSCKETAVACGPVPTSATRIWPGTTRMVLAVAADATGNKPAFDFHVQWQPSPPCVAPAHPDAASRADHKPTRPFANTTIGPPRPPPGTPPGTTAYLKFFVNAGGTTDSIHVIGITDSIYVATIRHSAMKYRFTPATDGFCPVAGAAVVAVELGQ